MADQLIARRWTIALGKLTAARANQDDAIDFVDTIAPMLALRFPDETFTTGSLEYVAAECKYLPTYGELVALLHDWKRSLPALSWPAINDNVVELPPEQRTWLAYWQRREAEHFAPLREPDGRLTRPDITDWREHTASLIRQVAPKAWEYLSAEDHAA